MSKKVKTEIKIPKAMSLADIKLERTGSVPKMENIPPPPAPKPKL